MRLLVLALFAALAVLQSGCVQHTAAPPRPSEPIGPIYAGHVAEQVFAARDSELVGLDVLLATYARRNRGAVVLRLRDASMGADVRAVQIDASSIEDNALHRFRFDAVRPRLTPSAWSFTIESDASSVDNAITVWATAADVIAGGDATYDGRAREADLVFAPIYADPLPAAVAGQMRRLAEAPVPPLATSLVLFGPGFALARLFISRARHGLALQVAAAPAFGLSAASLMTLYGGTAGLPLGTVTTWVVVAVSGLVIVAAEVVQASGGATSVFRLNVGVTPLPTPPPQGGREPDLPPSPSTPTISASLWRLDWCVAATAAAFVAGVVIRSIALEDGGVPPGADTYHHALIAQLILDNGGLPESYRPFAAIDSFAYHFGFHAFAALAASAVSVSGLDAVSWLGPLLSALPALSIFVLARTAGLGGLATAAAVVIVALVDPFPLDLVDIGRYPQLTALTILPVGLAFAMGYVGGRSPMPTRFEALRPIVGGALLTAGLFLTHYRILLFLVVLVGLNVLRVLVRPGGIRVSPAWGTLRFPTLVLVGGLALVGPWVGRLMEDFTLGVRGSGGRYAPEYYSLDRLGDTLAHPALGPLLVLGGLGLGLAIASITLPKNPLILSFSKGPGGSAGSPRAEPNLRGESLVALLGVWAALQIAISNPHWLPVPAAGWVDTVTVATSLFLPVSLAVGFLVQQVGRFIAARAPRGEIVLAFGIAGLAVWGALQLPSVIQPAHRLAQTGDLVAAGWIRENVAPGSRFLVNAFVLRWEPDFVAPTDGGYWLPLLAGHRTTLLPMVYAAERGASVAEVDRMERLARAGAAPASAESLRLFRESGVTHVYLGVRRGPIPEHAIAVSPSYRRVYRGGGVAIYELLGP